MMNWLNTYRRYACDIKRINERLDAVGAFADDLILREELREYLNPVYDIERLMGKINYHSANPRDLIAFANSIRMLPPIKSLLSDTKVAAVRNLSDGLDTLEDLCAVIDSSISEDAPINIKEGGIPLTMILVILIYLGTEVWDAFTAHDNISHLTHILGGVCGAVFGFLYAKDPKLKETTNL